MTDLPDTGLPDAAEAHEPDLLEIERGQGFVRLIADAANVEVQPGGIDIVILVRSQTPQAVVWPEANSQPSEMHLRPTIEEVARLRMAPAVANDLAMNIILEMSVRLGVSLQALERNFEVIRKRVAAARAEDADG